ncbi:MAG: adenylate/guanylate cyclase domain-containing protein [Acidimicrobiales bacterium]
MSIHPTPVLEHEPDSGRARLTVRRAIVFTDVVGSTAIAATQGDQVLLDLLECHDRLVALNASAFHGHIVKGTGDGAMLCFEQASRAIATAIQIQRQALGAEIPLRIGIDFGPVVPCEHGDYRGLVTHVASRLTDLARAGEVLVSERAARAGGLPGRTRPTRVRGLPARMRVRALAVTRSEI